MDILSIGIKIKNYRTDKGLTQEELAEKANLDYRTISLIERGKAKDIKATSVIGIANALEITPNELLAETLAIDIDASDNSIVNLFKPLSEENRKKVIEYISFLNFKDSL